MKKIIIKVERSGGLTGLRVSNEIDGRDLPANLLSKVKKIIANDKVASSPIKGAPRGAADHYTYKISIQDGLNRNVIECDQFNIQEDLMSIIKYVKRNHKTGR